MSDLALQLIAENKRTKSPFLDLGNCGLSEIPEEIGELDWLESLNLAGIWQECDGQRWQQQESVNGDDNNFHLTDLGVLSRLDRLRALYVSRTQVTDLAPLNSLSALQALDVSRTQITDLAPLAGLSALQSLSVFRTQITDLAPLAGLSALQSLYVSSTQITDLAPLAGLSALQSLYVFDTQITDLAPLAGLSALQSLYVFDTQITDLAPLAGLSALQSLSVSRTQITDLAPLAGLSALQTLDVFDTQITDLAPLAGLSALQSLSVSSTQITDLAPLAGLSALQSLSVSSTQITDLAPLAGLSALQSLSVSSTQITDLAPLAGLSALQSLDVSRTQITDLAPLAGLSTLQSLDVSHTEVADLAPLAGLSTLQSLSAFCRQITDLAPLAGLSTLQSLSVPGAQITDLAPLAGLSALQSLSVPGAQITDLAPLAGLSALQFLNVPGTQIADLAPLAGLSALQYLNVSGTQIADLAPLAGLSALQYLNVFGTQITDLAPLAGLSSLQTLNVSHTQITDLAPLAGLSSLQTLNVSNTQITDLTPLAGLSSLQTLNVSNTQITDLTPLAGLSALQTLDISGTQITDLAPLLPRIARGWPAHWSSDSWKAAGIYLKDCPLTNPPPEIVSQGNDAILNYLEERERAGVDYLYEAKMLILGEGGAGKTSLLRRLYQPGQPLPSEKESTKGISIHRHEFSLSNGRRFRLNVWDFGGQEIYHATHQFFLTRRSLYLLVDDTRKNHKSVSDEGFRYWLELIDVFGGHSPVLIFQNEKSGRSKAIDIAGIKGRYDNVKDLYSGDLERGNAADQLRHDLEFFASKLSHIGEELPARWIKVRADVEVQAGKAPHITQQEYFEIYGRHMELDRVKALRLSQYLHDLGVFLHFQDDVLLRRTVILQNQWATEAVFRILDDEAVKAKFGRFSSADCERLWRDSVYSEMHPELLALMQRFEFCYELRDTERSMWLAPQLLPPAKPEELHDWGNSEDLVLRYRYDFLPKGVISRLTVRLHRFVRRAEMAWVTGVLFERESTAVLVELLPNGSEIELRGRGPERKALLSIIASDLDALNDSFEGLRDKVDKLIPCNCKRCNDASIPEFFEQKVLLRRKEHSRLKVECPLSFEDVDVLDLLDGIRINSLPGWASEGLSAKPVQTIRIFLASSAELREDRDAFDLYLRQQNDRLHKRGLYLQIERWENFLDAMSETRLQDEYNKAVRQCDIFVCLFFTKTGKFTEEEFNVAYGQFRDNGKPQIYTYFKNADVKTSSIREEDFMSLLTFKKKLKELGHFLTDYENTEHLKRHFRDQLDMMFD